ncbi:MAG TPA: VWA domain-containing protein [Stellaceae bacterium]|nr:VWA domain-containing protein [Stellaceae bacterium]
MIDPELLNRLIVGGEAARGVTPGTVLLLGWVIAIVALAGPTWRLEPSPFAAAQRPAMIVLKVTPSMLSTDLAPTRLDRAREKLADLLALREGAPTGLIAYSGSAHLVLPPTPDGDVVLTMAKALSPQIMPREGDRLADAVALAGKILQDGGQGGSIVVFADTVAPDQHEPLRKHTIQAPVNLVAMSAYARGPDPSVEAAADALVADLVAATLDTTDVTRLAHRLAAGGAAAGVAGEGQRWQEAGYWLTPVIALLVLGWFRRGWVLA